MGKQVSPDEHLLLARAEETLRRVAGRLGDVTRFEATPVHDASAVDAFVSVGTIDFALECKWASDTASVVGAIGRLTRATRSDATRQPLLCVSHMGPAGRKLCEDAGLSWFDLAGNADVLAPHLYIHVEGLKGSRQRPGRSAGIFAPKASRVARWLLVEHPKPMSHRELVNAAGLGKGYVSRILSQMVAAGLLSEHAPHSFRVPDPSHLLAAWAEAYDFDKHMKLAGIIPHAPGLTNLRRVQDTLQSAGVRVAATGLAAAWALRKHADFRLSTVYVDRVPSTELLKRLGFRDEARGANLWMMLPADLGVFDGSASVGELTCVHPVQVLLDLAGQPERAAEAADELRTWLLERWRRS